jgi:hypothetical protein
VLSLKLNGQNLPESLEAIDRIWAVAGEPRPIRRSFFDQDMERRFAGQARQAQIFGAFAALALFVAALGLLGLSAFAAELRTKEIGIRKAMGARSRDVLALMLWQFAKPVLWANVIAWPLDHTDDLMPGHHRKDSPTPFIPSLMNIRMADPAIENLNKDVTRPNLSPFKRKGFERSPGSLGRIAFSC